jgi:hypothetical protein
MQELFLLLGRFDGIDEDDAGKPAGCHIRGQADEAFIRQAAGEKDHSFRWQLACLSCCQAPAWQKAKESGAEDDQQREKKPARQSMSHGENLQIRFRRRAFRSPIT